MMIRSTTNGVLKSYRYNLQRSSYTLNKAMNTVLTGRNFDTYAADPATAARCLFVHGHPLEDTKGKK